MITLKCKMCGGNLTIEEEQTVCECEYCGSKQTVPKVDDEKKMTLYDRANRLRFNCEFDKAATVYEQIVSEFHEEAEAYWGLVLCKYGIEYVDDPATAKKIPTCHRSSFDSVMDDSDFEMVMENADGISRSVYREQAKQIEEIRKDIIEVSGKEQPYDVFICYKETAEDGQRTIDSVLAQDVYDSLTDKGYRVFFSRISLEDKLGTEYEPYIFAALNSAKIMLAFGTTYDYYNAVWVKNEWSRFLKLMAKDKSKHLIPCYKDIDAYDIPKEFARLQAQDLGKVGAIQDLIRGIDKITGKTEKSSQVQNSQASPVVQQVVGGTNTNALIQRGFMALEDGEWKDADGFFEDVLNNDAQNSQAYLGKLLAEYQIVNVSGLSNLHKRFDNSKNYQKILKFADDTLKAELEVALKTIDDNIEYDRENEIYQGAAKLKNNKNYESAIAEFTKIAGFKDTQRQIEECKELDRQEKEEAAAVDKKVEAIAEVLKNYGKKDPVDVINEQITSKKSRIEMLNSEVNKLQNLAAILPKIEDEDSRLKAELESTENKITDLNAELNGLGFFSGKRKKEIVNEITNCQILIKRKKELVSENKSKMQGYSSQNLESVINLKTSEINKANEEIAGLNNQLESEVNKSRDRLSYDKAINMLKDDAIANTFEKKYPAINIKFRAKLNVGAIITLGKYKNQNIEWKVLKCEGDKYLLIADKALDCIPYNKKKENTTWESCTLRKWLNNTFIDDAFSTNEKNMIALTDVSATRNPRYSTNPGNNTKDKVFLLSIDEVLKYFSDDKARQCLPAASASKAYKSRGASSCWWWLRSPGRDCNNAVDVNSDGSVDCSGLDVRIDYAVRPALWINLE